VAGGELKTGLGRPVVQLQSDVQLVLGQGQGPVGQLLDEAVQQAGVQQHGGRVHRAVQFDAAQRRARLLLGQHLPQDRGERDLFRHLMHLTCGHAGQLLAQHADLPHPRQPFLELLQFGGGRQAGAQRFQVGLDGGEMHGHIATHLADDLQPVAFGVAGAWGVMRTLRTNRRGRV
jgi:hypothetical protein